MKLILNVLKFIFVSFLICLLVGVIFDNKALTERVEELELHRTTQTQLFNVHGQAILNIYKALENDPIFKNEMEKIRANNDSR